MPHGKKPARPNGAAEQESSTTAVFPFPDLPLAAKKRVLFQMLPEEILDLRHRSVSREWRELIQSNDLWRDKFKLHFPHHATPVREGTNWLSEFREAYDDEMSWMTDERRRLVSAVKENKSIRPFIDKCIAAASEGDVDVVGELLSEGDVQLWIGMGRSPRPQQEIF